MFHKIITHAGNFHADEILAIAVVNLIFSRENAHSFPIIRNSHPTEDQLNDPTIMVLDVGGRYEPALLNFDHHQDASLEATNVLVLNHFATAGGIDPDTAKELYRRLFKEVSEVDRGVKVLKDDSTSFNMLIRALNNIPENEGFETALDVAYSLLEGQVYTTIKYLQEQDRFFALEKVEVGNGNKGFAIQLGGDAIISWKEQAKSTGIMGLVCPNQRGGFSFVSRDTEEFTIPPHESQIFRHNSGFMATYRTVQEAIDHATTIVSSL